MANVTGQNLAGKSYQVVLGDPDWLFDLRSEKGEGRSPQAHYDCSPTDEISAFLKALLEWSCAPDCAFVMWCTWPMLARGDCHQVMRAAGFEPKTGGAWGKLTQALEIAMGGGYIYRSSSEPWLLGTRGAPKTRVKNAVNLILDPGLAGMVTPDELDGGLILAERREHSRKPATMYELIERQFPGTRKLEIFGRVERDGWDVWGDEVGKFQAV